MRRVEKGLDDPVYLAVMAQLEIEAIAESETLTAFASRVGVTGASLTGWVNGRTRITTTKLGQILEASADGEATLEAFFRAARFNHELAS